MKKTLTINLNKIIFNIDEDAYYLLRSYLDEIGNYFTKNDEKKDIMYDIEARIAELFSEKISTKNSVVTIEDVNEVIETMGKPSQYTDEDTDATEEKTSAKYNQKENRKAHRKLYRDIDDDMVGGVLAGLAKYLDWEVLPLRLAFLFLALFTSGTFILVYLIMWLVVPKAMSLSQKMEMRGENITIDTLNERSEEFRNSTNHKGSNLGTFFRVLIKIFLGFILLVFGTVGISVVGSLLILALTLLFIVPAGLIFGAGYIENDLMLISIPNLTLLTISSLLVVGVPIFILVYWLKRRKEKEQGSKMTYIISLLLLLAGIFMFLGSGVNIIDDLDNDDIRKKVHLDNTVIKTEFLGDKSVTVMTKETGNEITEERNVADFHGIKVEGIVPLEISQVKEGEQKVVVKVTPKYADNVKTEVKNGILSIYNNLDEQDDALNDVFIKVKVATDKLDYVKTSGVSKINFTNKFDVKNIRFDISGISKVVAKFNSAQKIDADVSGISKLILEGECDNLFVRVNGISKADISNITSKKLKFKESNFLSKVNN